MNILNISDTRHLIPEVASWFHEEWAHLNPGRTLQDVIELIHNTFEKEGDEIYVCVLGDEPISTITLRKNELSIIKDDSFWLSSLVVKKNMRKKGSGEKTIQLFLAQPEVQKKETLYLFTEDLEHWYNKLGWNKITEATFKGHSGVVMSKGVLR